MELSRAHKNGYEFATTIFAARQFVSHGHVLVNGKKVTVSSYTLKDGDIVEISFDCILSYCTVLYVPYHLFTTSSIALTIDIYLVLLFLSYISTYLKKHIQPFACRLPPNPQASLVNGLRSAAGK